MESDFEMTSNNYWIDTHAHIFSDEFKQDIENVISRSEKENVRRIYMPNIDHSTIDGLMEIESRYSSSRFAMIGLHPCSVKKDFEKELYLIEDWLAKRKFVAIGEMGTDLYWDKTFWNEQKEAFKIQVEWAKKNHIPVVIHCRESINETIDLLQPLLDGKLKGVFHCFTGTAQQAKIITDMGFYVGLGGVATFKNGGLDKVIPDINIDSIVLETDSPYLAPVPHRGKRNEPSYIPIIAQRVADLKQMSLADLQSITTQNALKLFNATI